MAVWEGRLVCIKGRQYQKLLLQEISFVCNNSLLSNYADSPKVIINNDLYYMLRLIVLKNDNGVLHVQSTCK